MQHLDPALDDLSAVQADDLLLDHLGSAVPGAAGQLGDDNLNALLLAWRNEAETQPMPELVDLDTATAFIAYATSWWTTNTPLKIAALVLFLTVLVAVALVLTATDAGGVL
jgi:hypothetical protein